MQKSSASSDDHVVRISPVKARDNHVARISREKEIIVHQFVINQKSSKSKSANWKERKTSDKIISNYFSTIII